MFQAVECESDFPMSTVLDGVMIDQNSCTVAMSRHSKQYVNVRIFIVLVCLLNVRTFIVLVCLMYVFLLFLSA